MDENRINELKRAVLAGGGTWIGIQETIEPPALVLFQSPTTGSTLALFEDLLTAERVHAKITRSDKAFASAPVKISRVNYDKILEHVREITAILIEEKR